MNGQRKLVDGVRDLSHSAEQLAEARGRDIPDKVTVKFRAGRAGILDLTNPRAIHWARRIEELQRSNRPVYVEIDDETGTITNFREPRRLKVQSVDPLASGDLQVLLIPSSALHFLLRSDPEFAAMRASLEAARADGSERLITETRDEHEIIDVAMPDGPPEEGPPPGPPPPEDPPVSEARAGDIFDNMKAESCDPLNPSSTCIPFLFPDDGCWIRAHIMCHLMRNGGPDTTANPPEDPEKIWIEPYPLVTATANHPDCKVIWGWHVAPTLMVTRPGGDEKWVIDPAVSPSPESTLAWKGRQGNAAATLYDTDWTVYGKGGSSSSVSLAAARNDPFIVTCRNDLRDRSLQFGPPPYGCTRGSFFIVDRSTFSDDEVEAMLLTANPALVEAAFYVVVDGFAPQDLGFTAATMQRTPTLNVTPMPTGMTITPVRVEFEDPTHLNRRQRLTWVYDVSFANTSAFTSALIVVTLQASMSTIGSVSSPGSVSSTGYLYLVQQPAPYEVDGPTSWLSTDLRVFQIRQGQSRFNANLALGPNAFITQALSNLNSGTAGGDTFDGISTDQNASRLELSGTVNGTPVHNFAIAKVRYRSLLTSATDVRVFFRLFPWATSSVEYDQATAYRRHTAGGTVVPLLGIKNNQIVSIPCFAAPRIDSAAVSMTTQTDPANLQSMPPDALGQEVVRYFGCWLDINQMQPQFPDNPNPADGPYMGGRESIQDKVRNEHQCLVSEIVFTPAPIPNGSSPAVSDKLAQRNLAIVEAANPGVVFSRRVPQTFEIRPSALKQDHDELMIDWGNVPQDSIATLYIPGLNVDDILLLAAKKYRTHRLIRIDAHTLKFATGGINYLPIPFTDLNLPGLLTVDLPAGIKKGQSFKIVVRQVSDEQRIFVRTVTEKRAREAKRVVGAFQLTIPVSTKAAMLSGQQRLLSTLRWIERAIPQRDRWELVFKRYVAQVAARVDDLGGDSSVVAPSSSGQWQEAHAKCRLYWLAVVLLLAALAIAGGVAPIGIVVVAGISIAGLFAATIRLWRKNCRPTRCQLLRALFCGWVLGALALALILLFGVSTTQLVIALLISSGAAVATGIVAWAKGCLR